MKFLAFLPALLVLDIFTPTYQSSFDYEYDSTRHDDDYDRETTRLPEYTPTEREFETTELPEHTSTQYDHETTRSPVTTTPNRQPESTTTGMFFCDSLEVLPKYVSKSVRENVTFECTCRSHFGNIREENCPQWKQVDNVLHSHSRKAGWNTCTATIKLVNLESRTRDTLTCFADGQEIHAHLQVDANHYDEQCQEDKDCISPFKCKNSRCNCPDTDPLYLPQKRPTCHPVKHLLNSCWNSIQCQASDNHAYCTKNTTYGNDEGFCLCKSGYENEDGKCVSSDSVYSYVYSFSKRYQTVFYVLLATAIALVLVGLLRICFMRRRGPVIRVGRVLSPNASDEQPIITTENEKSKF